MIQKCRYCNRFMWFWQKYNAYSHLICLSIWYMGFNFARSVVINSSFKPTVSCLSFTEPEIKLRKM